MTELLAAGRLLVATPQISEPTFARTVILLLAHGPDGSLGVVLNRPSETPCAVLLPQWAEHVAEPSLVFIGGPVETDSVIGLSGNGPVDLNLAPDIEESQHQLRMFAGSAGWGPGQLEGEMEEGAWWVIDGDASDTFTDTPATLWRTVLKRQPVPTAWFADYPVDPMLN